MREYLSTLLDFVHCNPTFNKSYNISLLFLSLQNGRPSDGMLVLQSVKEKYIQLKLLIRRSIMLHTILPLPVILRAKHGEVYICYYYIRLINIITEKYL